MAMNRPPKCFADARIAGEEHRAHAAAFQLFDDLVATDEFRGV